MLQKKCSPEAAPFVVVVFIEAGSGGDRSHVLEGTASLSMGPACRE